MIAIYPPTFMFDAPVPHDGTLLGQHLVLDPEVKVVAALVSRQSAINYNVFTLISRHALLFPAARTHPPT